MSGAPEHPLPVPPATPPRALLLSLALHGGLLGVFMALSWAQETAPKPTSPWQVSVIAPAPAAAVAPPLSPTAPKPAAAGKPKILTPPQQAIAPAAGPPPVVTETTVPSLPPSAAAPTAPVGVLPSAPESGGATVDAGKAAADDAAMASAQQIWYGALVAKLREFRHYPTAARRLGQEGVVILLVEIGADGELRDSEVLESSGFPLLDTAATRLLREAAAALRGQLQPPGESRLEVPIAYRLENG
jgi:protein TonB